MLLIISTTNDITLLITILTKHVYVCDGIYEYPTVKNTTKSIKSFKTFVASSNFIQG